MLDGMIFFIFCLKKLTVGFLLFWEFESFLLVLDCQEICI